MPSLTRRLVALRRSFVESVFVHDTECLERIGKTKYSLLRCGCQRRTFSPERATAWRQGVDDKIDAKRQRMLAEAENFIAKHVTGCQGLTVPRGLRPNVSS